MSRCAGRACRSATAGKRSLYAISGGEGSRRPTTVPSPLSAAGAGKVRLGDVLSVKARIGWQGLTQKEHRVSGEYNLVTGTDFVDGKVDFSKCVFVDKERYDQDENIQLRNGDLLITKDGTIGKVAVVENMPRPATLNSGVFVVRDVASNFLIRYLYHFFLAPEFRKLVDGKLTGCTIAHLNQKVLVNLSIPLPPLPTQQRIADELDQLCALKKNAEDRLAILDQIVKSRFVEMFGDPTQNDRNLPLAFLPDFGENLDGRRIPITSSDRIEGPYPYYGASGIVDHVEGFIFDEDLLLISEDGANLLLRSTPIAFSVKGKVWVNNHAHVIRFPDLATQVFVEHFLNAVKIDKYVTGSAQPKLNQAKLNSIPIMNPPLALQREFAAFVAEVDKSKLTLRETVATLDQLYRAKLQEYFG